jgi:serine/threonine protein kinase
MSKAPLVKYILTLFTSLPDLVEVLRNTPFDGILNINTPRADHAVLSLLQFATDEYRLGELQDIIVAGCNARHEQEIRALFMEYSDTTNQEHAIKEIYLSVQSAIESGQKPDSGLVRQLTSIRRKRNQEAWTIHDYKKQEELGSGGFARVCIATNQHTGQKVVVRELHHHLRRNHSTVQRFLFGARILQVIKHPHIAKLYHVEGNPPRCFLEYYPNGTLYDAVAKGRLSAGEAVEAVLSIGSALATAHRLGIIHRDVKPLNILLDAKNRAVLIDFDLSLIVADGDRQSVEFSTRYYSGVFSAPELTTSTHPITPSADVYSLAMTALFCISGEMSTVNMERADSIRELALTGELAELFVSATAANPAERPPTMDEFCSRLKTAIETVDMERFRRSAKQTRAARATLRLLRSNTLSPSRAAVVAPWTSSDVGSRDGRTSHLGVYPVTNQEYHCFLRSGGYSTSGLERWWSTEGQDFWRAYVERRPHPAGFDKFVRPESDPIDRPKDWDHRHRSHALQPVGSVCWFEVEAYCRWLREFLNHHEDFRDDVVDVRLPTLGEWLRGAGYEDERRYPWGNQPADQSMAACFEDSLVSYSGAGANSFVYPDLIGKRPNGRSSIGCEDLIGNIWEWVAWSESTTSRLVCGGCIHDRAERLTFDRRLAASPFSPDVNEFKGFIQQRSAGYRHPAIGFRILVERRAKTLQPA